MNRPFRVCEIEGTLTVKPEGGPRLKSDGKSHVFHFDDYHAFVGGVKMSWGDAERAALAARGPSVTVKYVKGSSPRPCTREEALKWFAEILMEQIPPSFRNEVQVIVSGGSKVAA